MSMSMPLDTVTATESPVDVRAALRAYLASAPSQRVAAQRLGLPRSSVLRIASGDAVPPPDLAKRIQRAASDTSDTPEPTEPDADEPAAPVAAPVEAPVPPAAQPAAESGPTLDQLAAEVIALADVDAAANAVTNARFALNRAESALRDNEQRIANLESRLTPQPPTAVQIDRAKRAGARVPEPRASIDGKDVEAAGDLLKAWRGSLAGERRAVDAAQATYNTAVAAHADAVARCAAIREALDAPGLCHAITAAEADLAKREGLAANASAALDAARAAERDAKRAAEAEIDPSREILIELGNARTAITLAQSRRDVMASSLATARAALARARAAREEGRIARLARLAQSTAYGADEYAAFEAARRALDHVLAVRRYAAQRAGVIPF